jgi:thymidylate kinase
VYVAVNSVTLLESSVPETYGVELSTPYCLRAILLTIALEGPCCSGKTTLASILRSQLGYDQTVVFPDYVDAAGGIDNVPAPSAQTVEDELASLRFFLALDLDRWRRGFLDCTNPLFVILDRSVHTLLAHRYACEQISSMPVFEVSCQITGATNHRLFPEIVLYLDVPQRALDERYKQRGQLPSLFTDVNYNRNFRSYFVPELKVNRGKLSMLDGTLPTNDLAATANHIILSELRS